MDDLPAQPSDGALLASLARGDSTALAELVRRHQAALLRHARALLGSAGDHCEDAVQETFLKLLERPPELPPEVRGDAVRERAQLSSWLHKVARNHCMDILRSEGRRRMREEASAAPEAAPPTQVGGAELVEQLDTRARVEAELGRLPPDQREVLVLRLLGERSYKEIAEITGRKIGTVGWLVSEGLRALSLGLAPLVAVEAAPRGQVGNRGGGR